MSFILIVIAVHFFLELIESITLSVDAQNIKITMEKEVFFDTWSDLYNGTLTDVNTCIRITGVTFYSDVEPYE